MSQPITILHITYDMNIGGTEQVIRNLVEGLDPARFRSVILCIDGAIGPWGQQLQQKGFPVIQLTRKPGFDIALIRQIRQILQQHNIDIIHGHQYTPYTYGWFAALLSRNPVIFTEHGRFYPDFSTLKRRLINPVLQRRTAAITAISAATKLALEVYEFFDSDRIKVIYNGIADLSTTISAEQVQTLKQSLNLQDDAIVFGTISRLDPIKNQAMMLRAFQAAKSRCPNIRLLVVGGGPERQNLEALQAQLGLQDSVIFTGFQPNPQVYLAAMDVFLLPSLSEGTSMTLLEAMSFGKPTIATAVGGTPEIIKHGEHGLLIQNKDEPALTDAIVRLAQNGEQRIQLGTASRQQYRRAFTTPVMCSQYQQLYSQLV